MKKIAKFKEKIKRWSKRDLLFEGKKILINAFIMSSLAYLWIFTHLTYQIYSYLKQKISFEISFGEGKHGEFPQKAVALRKIHGRFEIPDLESFIISKKIKWVMRIHFSAPERWNMLGKKYFKI